METQIATATEYRNVPLSVLNESKTNPRRTFEPTALKELAESIRTLGVLSPLLVRPLTENGFEIIAGARRYRAAQIAEQSTVPVRIVHLSDAAALEAQLAKHLAAWTQNNLRHSLTDSPFDREDLTLNPYCRSLRYLTLSHQITIMQIPGTALWNLHGLGADADESKLEITRCQKHCIEISDLATAQSRCTWRCCSVCRSRRGPGLSIPCSRSNNCTTLRGPQKTV
jgi:hypothetical protein